VRLLFSKALQLLECHVFFGHYRRKGRTAHLLLTLEGFRADLFFAESMVAFAKSPREGFVLFRNLLLRNLFLYSGTFFCTQEPLFSSL
jgi:hypothetical protein